MTTLKHEILGCLLSGALIGCATADPGTLKGQSVRDEPPTAEKALALSVQPAAGPAAPPHNPFQGADFFVDDRHLRNVLQTAKLAPKHSERIAVAARFPTGLWLDRIEAVAQLPGWLDRAGQQQAERGKPVVPVVVVYNLPNRDCAARASSGELLAFAAFVNDRPITADSVNPAIDAALVRIARDN